VVPERATASSGLAAFSSDIDAAGTLHPEHLADLQRSGLTEATICAARLRTVPPADLVHFLGRGLAGKVESALLIPYLHTDDFCRLKLFPPVAGTDGTIRYYQPPGTAPRLYVPPGVRPAFADPARALYVVEGEKKALRGWQDGMACVAIGGIWSWRHEGRAIGDLDRIDWCERETILVPDSDVWTRPDLLRAVYALGKTLEQRGATVRVLKLPAGDEAGKAGLDDFLCRQPRERLDGLRRVELAHAVFHGCSGWWRTWRARADQAAPAPPALAMLSSVESVHTIHPALDIHDGVLYYALPVSDGALVVVTSKREVLRVDELPARGLVLRHTEPGTSSVTRDAALAYMGGSSGSVGAALDGIADYLARHIAFRDRRTPAWLAAWALGTWCYRAFRVFPYVSIRSPEKRCGKSRLLRLLSRVAFNASPATAAPTEAYIFREAERRSGAQFFDEIDALSPRTDRERYASLLAVLNVGFERGGAVARQEKRGERFVTVEHDCYAPRALAGIAALMDTLEDRCLSVVMARRRRDETIARITSETEAEAAQLRQACALACLTRIGDIVAAAEQAPRLLHARTVDDRAVDLWAPLLALALVADGEDNSTRAARILDVAHDLSDARDAGDADGKAARLVTALEGIRQRLGERIAPCDLLAALRAIGDEWEWVRSTKTLAGLLAPHGLVSRSARGLAAGGKGRAYVLDAATLVDLAARYAPSDDSSQDRQEPPATLREAS
jgi:hypothetical protein